ncbi:single-stranded-DNA-specific exonuclease RecJ [Chitinophaga nivalis]|uniref:Single-stranded-DNA-specific exonuclease RecJ n=1 Tax=Chitinophaga nivalis TaxID=2991709 RepID=A0ABT3ISS4_9BACT|nr:single-stranded-DNA-specific exonuclease RecJ [Chitinophaga nivalis]MCW3463273.1 single-stranded-DNA-specific exonuclease RecJ [Chitinophaga nivalis]MCW3487037.1 single-stranded-DNA-specific exonuclease RecJ [Chitinophaga nivalis]
MQKRWTVKAYQPNQEQLLQSSLRIHPLLCRLLVQRGVTNYEIARQFFRPSLSDLHDPWLMKDMDKAISRIELAFFRHEKILIYGDYDVDGTTAVATVYAFLQKRYQNIEFYIPHRYREGYGISMQGIEYARDNDFSLVIALDCGIKSIEHITYAKELGIDFIICDHHLPDAVLPPAVAILNPKQQDCTYPYKELSGCGIGYKLIAAFAQKRGLPPAEANQFLDLVATSIAADIVPMTGENRILAFHGLIKVNEDPLPGIKALITLSGLKEQLTIANLVFVIAPRVNAAGRMDDARKAVNLFIENDADKAMAIAEVLHADNFDRKEIDNTITQEAISLLQGDTSLANKKSTVLYQSHWHKGVVGIVASRLIDKYYYRPTVILTQSNDKVAGSARSVTGFNVYEAIHQCKDLLENYGGHFYAAGMTLKPENVKAFQDRFEEVVANTIQPDQLVPEIVIDSEIHLSDITTPFFNILKQFEPLGPDNLRPVFLARNITDNGFSRLVKEEHIKFSVRQGRSGQSISGIGFYMSEKYHIVASKKPFDMVFTIDENEWNGHVSLQLKVIDIRPSH